MFFSMCAVNAYEAQSLSLNAHVTSGNYGTMTISFLLGLAMVPLIYCHQTQ